MYKQYVIVDKDGKLLDNELERNDPHSILIFNGQKGLWDAQDTMEFLMQDNIDNCYRGFRIEEYDPAKHIWRQDK